MRLAEDNSSWKSRGIQRRMYRQAPLTPEDETPRHRRKHKKPKHVHDYKVVHLGFQTATRYFHLDGGGIERRESVVPKTIYICTKCGYRRGYRW